MGIEFSIVIPSYNRAKQLILTLISFNKQNFPMDQFEVIVVDDCSTDETSSMVEQFTSPYSLIYLKSETRNGPAHARNLGIKRASGRIVIFCDADFIVQPHFLREIQKHHATNPKSVISGTPGSYKMVYTHYYPEFTRMERNNLKIILVQSGMKFKRLFNSKKIVELITPEELDANFQHLYKLVGWEMISPELKKAYLQTDVAPWLLFITRCVSVEKKYLEEVGGFDERLIRGAGEDWELGFKLYRLGLSFVGIEESLGFHQEHPNSFRKPFSNFTPFYKLLLEKFEENNPEILLLSLWRTSDDLWHDIAVYKNILRMLNRYHELPREQQLLLDLLLLSCASRQKD